MLLTGPHLRLRSPSLLFRLGTLLAVFSLACSCRIDAAEVTPRLEYQVKAGYLFNFLRFTEWPVSALPAGTPYRIGVIGDAATSHIIADSLRGKMINERAIEVVWIETGTRPAGCHLVFIPKAISFLMNEVPPPPILTVGETDNYASTQGIIGFVSRGYSIRFQVNLPAAQRAGLKLSGRLASLAEIVRSP